MLILECMSNEETRNEGRVVYNYLNMFHDLPVEPRLKRVLTKKSFLQTLEYSNENFIHVSTHGSREKESYYIDLPNGEVYPEDFEDFDFSNVQIIFTGCLLGRGDFAGRVSYITKAKYLIAPFNNISFVNSATFCILFYYHLFTRNSLSFSRSYTWVAKRLPVKGALRLY